MADAASIKTGILAEIADTVIAINSRIAMQAFRFIVYLQTSSGER
jgi:hypothetical protein